MPVPPPLMSASFPFRAFYENTDVGACIDIAKLFGYYIIVACVATKL